MTPAIVRPLVLLGLALAGCTPDRPAEAAVPPASPQPATPRPATQIESPEPVAAATPPDNQTRRELGAGPLAIVEQADTAGAARLRVIGAQQAMDAALTADGQIGGYPIEAPLVTLDAATRERLLQIVLDDASYAYGLARRCANDHLVGVRFQRGQERVELALGVPCMQAFWSSGSAGAVRRSGGPLRDGVGEAVLALLAGAGVRGAQK